MIRRISVGVGIALLSASAALADFSYKETATITGGMMASMMKVAGVFSKSAKEPIESTIAIKGNKMMHRSKDSASIVDLDAETITSVDFQKKTYSVMTFAEMKKVLDDAMRAMEKKKDGSPDISFTVAVDNTGKTRQVDGREAKESILKMDMESTDPKTGQKAPAMRMTSDMWMVTGIAGYDEVRAFQTKMAEKLNWTPGGNMFMNRPDMAKGMAGMVKEMSKLNGVPALQFVSMGAAVPAGAEGQQAPPPQQPQAEKPSLGGMLGGKLGGFGLGRKKKEEAPASAPAADSGAPASMPGALIEMKTEMSAFSTAPVDALQFEVPGGFKKVEADLKKLK